MYNMNDKIPLCPYCGRRIYDFDRTVDHIVPKSIGRDLRWDMSGIANFIRDVGFTGNPVNIPNNLIYAHKACNSRKGSRLFVPDWSPAGSCMFWEVRYLHWYARYLYAMSNVLIYYYSRLIELNPRITLLVESWSHVIKVLRQFQKEYEIRLRTGNWFIDNV